MAGISDMTMLILGVDTGGTFTDFVLFDAGQLRIHKVLSTPNAPEQAIIQGILDLGLDKRQQALFIVHGSTVATNAVLEGKGVRTAMITNRGFADVLSIGRQARRSLYDLQPEPQPGPVPSCLCLQTGGRIGADGSLVEPLNDTDLEQLRIQIAELAPQAVAVNLLFSFADPRFERAIAKVLPESMFVSLSSDVLPESKEYERGIATWLNASVGPIVEGYLTRLNQRLASLLPGPQSLSVMQSSGGTVAASQAARFSVNLLLSGPAGGMAGAKFVAESAGQSRLLTFDMGGTSTDVALIDGELQLTSEGSIAGFPVAVPMVDMHTIGAGGGSIASVDQGGLLKVGPESAGADPGPACYGQGGRQATVSDANLILGRLQANAFLGGRMRLDKANAVAALAPLAEALGLDIEQTAAGIIRLVDEHMARALRVMSVQRGIDPRQLCLVSFGGAGGLHVCSLAEALEIPTALVPIQAGVLSALGMLTAPRSRELSHAVNKPLRQLLHADLDPIFVQLSRQGRDALIAEGVQDRDITELRRLDLRYQGQSYNLSVDWHDAAAMDERFHQLHQQRYGHQLDLPLEVVNARLSLSAPAQTVDLPANQHQQQAPQMYQKVHLAGYAAPVPCYQRSDLHPGQTVYGPALITETVSTTYLADEWLCTPDMHGNLLLSRV